MRVREISIREISEIIGKPFIGNGDLIINGLNLINRESSYDSILSYLTSFKLVDFIRNDSKLRALILTEELYNEISKKFDNIVYFITMYPEEVFYKLHSELYESNMFYDRFDFKSVIGENCKIACTTVIESGVVVGNNVTIGDFSIIKKGSIIGDNTYIGNHTIIGSEGFQDIKINGINTLIPHVGGCTIGANVSIFDNTCVCNSLFENTTTIGNNTKIDNLVHIAHNCIIGSNCTLTAGTILCGSTVIENNVWIAPNVSVLNKVVLKENSMIGLGAVVLRDVENGDVVVGNPAKSIRK